MRYSSDDIPLRGARFGISIGNPKNTHQSLTSKSISSPPFPTVNVVNSYNVTRDQPRGNEFPHNFLDSSRWLKPHYENILKRRQHSCMEMEEGHNKQRNVLG
jgi:hypothetical protein